MLCPLPPFAFLMLMYVVGGERVEGVGVLTYAILKWICLPPFPLTVLDNLADMNRIQHANGVGPCSTQMAWTAVRRHFTPLAPTIAEQMPTTGAPADA